ncbi:MAG: hypothetical protein KQI62_05675 [Deltaproteobacteria bacterium]|nr:hypothetical protein [Deltaproteobacteria bacterium]
MITTLLASAPFIFVNLSTGDQAQVTYQPCGCPMWEVGWNCRLGQIRSFEKLTLAGVTLMDFDLVHLLENGYPLAFGGGPTDYQLLEQEGPDGGPRLTLLVDPSLGPIDPEALKEFFWEHLEQATDAQRIMGMVLARTECLRVIRQPPRPTTTGKILHLHREIDTSST